MPEKLSPSRHLRIARSKAGLGLFTRVPIKKGQFIVRYSGRKIRTEVADEPRYRAQGARRSAIARTSARRSRRRRESCERRRRDGGAVVAAVTDPTNFRMERIEKLLHELRYEIERGMLEHDIDETLQFRFYVPISRAIPDGVVFCEFHTRPLPRYAMHPDELEPRLKIVK